MTSPVPLRSPSSSLRGQSTRQEILDKCGNTDGIDVLHNQILVAIYIRPEVTQGGIYLADQTIKEDEYQGKCGLVLKSGPLAFKSDDRNDFAGTGGGRAPAGAGGGTTDVLAGVYLRAPDLSDAKRCGPTRPEHAGGPSFRSCEIRDLSEREPAKPADQTPQPRRKCQVRGCARQSGGQDPGPWSPTEGCP